jgi:hypothetical protein
VSIFDGADWTNYTKAGGLVSSDIRSLAIDQAGRKWFGAYNSGVSEFFVQYHLVYLPLALR